MLLGIISVSIAGLGFGCNYAVTKSHDMKDGFHFQFIFACGVYLMSFLTLSLWHFNNQSAFEIELFPKGLLSGCIWSIANSMTIAIVTNLGLGPGFSTWNSVNVLGAFIIGRLALFGLKYEPSSSPLCGIIGVLIGVIGLILFGQLSTSDELTEPLVEEKPKRNTKLGFAMAIFAGICYAFNFVPLKLHMESLQDPILAKSAEEALRFSFSNMTGIFLTSLIIFVGYVLIYKEKCQFLHQKSWFPSMVGGMIWAIASFGASVATAELGLTIGFPVLANTAFLVNNLLSYFVFKEIKGQKNLKIFCTANVLVVVSSILLALSAP